MSGATPPVYFIRKRWPSGEGTGREGKDGRCLSPVVPGGAGTRAPLAPGRAFVTLLSGRVLLFGGPGTLPSSDSQRQLFKGGASQQRARPGPELSAGPGHLAKVCTGHRGNRGNGVGQGVLPAAGERRSPRLLRGTPQPWRSHPLVTWGPGRYLFLPKMRFADLVLEGRVCPGLEGDQG